MSSIAKGIGVGGINTRGVALTVLVVLLVVGLFFIPEIINFQRGLTGLRSSFKSSSTTSNRKAESTILPPVTSEQPVVDASTSNRAVARGSNFFDRLIGFFQGGAGISASRIRSASDNARRSSPLGIGRTRSSSDTSGGPITWQILKSVDSMASLHRAHDDAVALARTLPSRYQDTINSLFAYASGIEYVTKSAEQTMEATRAFAFLEQLDAAVTSAMQREKVPSSEFNLWSKVSLGPAFSQSTIIKSKENQQMPFTPNLRIVSVRILQPADTHRQWVENNPAILHLVGAVEGRDVDRIEVYRDGERLNDRIPRRPDRFGLRYFFIRGGNARGVYTFRVHDRGGQSYAKSYHFYNRARMYPWLAKRKGRFAIPFGDFDPRLDRVFVWGNTEIRKSTSSSYFTSSVGNDFARF